MSSAAAAHVRAATRVLPARVHPMGSAGGQLLRCLGSKGLDNRGVEFAVGQVGPFILVDGFFNVTTEKPPASPFGIHPHCGFTAITVLLEGSTKHVSNASKLERGWLTRRYPDEREVEKGGSKSLVELQQDVDPKDLPRGLLAGGVALVYAGRGACHDELNAGLMSGYQIWCAAETPALGRMAPSEEDFQADALPVVKLPEDGGEAVVLAGEFHGTKSPAQLSANPSGVVVLRVQLRPGARHVDLNIPLAWEAALYVSFGSPEVQVSRRKPAGDGDGDGQEGGADGTQNEEVNVAYASVAVFEAHAAEGPLRVSNSSQTDTCEFLLIGGAPLTRPWVKLLGYEGGLICATEEEARAKLAAYEADPVNFGVE